MTLPPSPPELSAADPATPGPTVVAEGGIPRLCGNCHLWGPNFYRRYTGFPVNTTCAADAVMDLPASFIPNRQTMRAEDGEGCIAWCRKEAPTPIQSREES